jgi:ABC-type nitrate/sulfonate/bicarbonate transport system permease component
VSQASRGVQALVTRRPLTSGDGAPQSRRPAAVLTSAGSTAWAVIKDGRLVSFVVLVGIWQLIAALLHVSAVALPAPSQVATGWWDVLVNSNLLGALGFSVEVTLIGFGIAVLIGVPAGIAMGLVRRFRYVIDPYVTILLSTPYVAFVPVLLTWTGLGTKAQIAAAFLFSFPFIVVNSEAGIRELDASMISMARSYETPPLQIFRKVVLPGASPFIFLGFKLGMSHGFKGVIIAEMIISYAGIGGLVSEYGGAFRTDHLLAVIITALVAVLVINGIFRIFHRWLMPWQVFRDERA